VTSFFGRILTGGLADVFWQTWQIQRVYFVLVAAGFTLAGCWLMQSVADISGLGLVSSLIGIGYGCIWTILPVLVAEFWGIDAFASKW
jgi:hypothetical protein